jgi:hypothetical protein
MIAVRLRFFQPAVEWNKFSDIRIAVSAIAVAAAWQLKQLTEAPQL